MMKRGWMALIGAVALGGTVGLLVPAPGRDAEATVADMAGSTQAIKPICAEQAAGSPACRPAKTL
jgi:hypothetical protein